MTDDLLSAQRAYADDALQAQLESEVAQLDRGKDRFTREQACIQDDIGFGSRDDASNIIMGCRTQVFQVIQRPCPKEPQLKQGKLSMSNSPTGADKQLLHKVSLLMSAFRNINPTMSIQVVHTLMLIALHKGASVTEIAKMSGFKIPTVSRNILDLGKHDRRRAPGLGLVETKVDPMELRKKQVGLTPKGEMLLRQIIDIMKV